MSGLKTSSSPQHPGSFATTHWSMVVQAGRADSPEAQSALASLCERYWYPLYAFVRRRGVNEDEAQDLIQEFFTRLLELDLVKRADRQRGRFRSFLLAALEHFLANEWRRAAAQKRGGGRLKLSLDFPAGQGRYANEPATDLTPESEFERRWALAILDRVLAEARREYDHAGKLAQFERLKGYLGGEDEHVPYRQVADELAISEGAVKVAVHRLRRRCRELLLAEIAQTVASPDDVDQELRDLFAVFSRPAGPEFV